MGSIPTTPANYYGGCGEVVNASDCGSDIRGFDSHQSPHFDLLCGRIVFIPNYGIEGSFHYKYAGVV